MKKEKTLKAVDNITKKEYGVKHIAQIVTSVLLIVSTAYTLIGTKITWWKLITSPMKTLTAVKLILDQVNMIIDSYDEAWMEIKDFKTNEIDDLMTELIVGFKEIFG